MRSDKDYFPLDCYFFQVPFIIPGSGEEFNDSSAVLSIDVVGQTIGPLRQVTEYSPMVYVYN